MDANRTTLKNGLVWLMVLTFASFVVAFFYSNPERFERFYSLSLLQIGLLLTLSLLVFTGLGLQSILMLRPYRTRLSLTEAFGLAIANNLLNYLPLKSGAIGKGLYLKRVYRLTLKHYAAALGASQLLWVAISGVLGCLSYFVLIGGNNPVAVSLTLIALVLFLAAVSALLLLYCSRYLIAPVPSTRFRNMLSQFSRAIATWHSDYELLRNFTLVSLLLFLVFALKIGFSFSVLGAPLSIFEAVFLQACVAVGFAFSFIPGNLGVKEGMLVGLAVAFGIEAETALLAALIDRTASLLPTLLLGPLFLQRLGRKL